MGKYYAAHTIYLDGPENESLAVTCKKEPITRDIIEGKLADLFSKSEKPEADKAAIREEVFRFLHKGIPVSIGDKSYSYEH